MLKTLIVADDSTGANASAILLKKLNLTTLSLIDHLHVEITSGYDVIAISTDSRAVSAKDAFTRVSNVLYQSMKSNPLIFNKRIDSTLRGNIGSELNAFRESFPDKKIAIIPAFPNSKRTCINGEVYVAGIRLEDTDAAKDPKMPIDTSNAKRLFKKQFIGTIENIYLSEIRNNKNLSKNIQNIFKNSEAIIFDAETNQDIEIIATSLVETNLDIICVDPGPFTYYYTKEMLNLENKQDNKYVFLVGSVVDTTFEQIKTAADNSSFEIIALNPRKLTAESSIEDDINNIIDKVKNTNRRFICITTTDPTNRLILNLQNIALENNASAEEISKIITFNMAKILTSILTNIPNIGGIFTSGGDVTLGFLNRISASGINLLKEVMPLCVYGKIVGGKFDGLPIITKGGMIGNANAYIEIKDFLEEVKHYE